MNLALDMALHYGGFAGGFFLLNHFVATTFYAVLQKDKNFNGESKPYFAFGVIMLWVS